MEIAKSSELKRIFLKSQRPDMHPYTEEEWYEFRMLALSMMLQAQALFAQRDLGLEYNEQLTTWFRSIRGVIDSFPAWQRYWREAREEGNLDAGFIQAIDAIDDGIDMKKILAGGA